MNKKKIITIIAIPLLLGTLYSGLKCGFINPMVKGLDVHILGGTFITNINKYVIKVGDKVGLSAGDYVVVPAFSKKPNLKFAILDDNGVLSIKGNNVIAEKEGISSVGILNKNRVLRKVTIMVVNPKINNMDIKLSNPIKYYGDIAKIESTVKIDDFKKLEKGYKLNYSTSNPKILKINGDTVEAVGLGEAKLISKYDRKEIQTSFNILPRVDSMEIKKRYELEEGQSVDISPKIKTSPKDSRVDVKYRVLDKSNYKKFNEKIFDNNKVKKFGDSGLEESKGIDISKDGEIKAYREGNYLVEVSSGEIKKRTIVDVRERSFKNIEVENLQYIFNREKSLLEVELGWDYDDRVERYRVYVKPKDGEFSLFTTFLTGKNTITNGNRISEIIKLDIDKNKDYDYQIYVAGFNGEEETKRSNIIRISNDSTTDFQKKKVKKMKYKVDRENSTIAFLWTPIEENENCTYRIYSKDLDYKDSKYKLVAKNIKDTSTIIKIRENAINNNYYIVAINSDGQISGFSEPVKIKENFSD